MSAENAHVLHHLGFVVASIGPSMQGFLRSLNATWDGTIFEDPIQRVKVAFLTAGAAGPQIELVEPLGDRSPVLKFLREKGGGMHHLCYQVEDLEGELKAMRSRGAMLVRPPASAVAFEGRRIAWVLTPEMLLIELLEAASK